MSNANTTTAGDVKLRIMVIDDDDFQLEVTKEVLNELGFNDVLLASSGADALSQFGRAIIKPHLLICDLSMPGMDGFEFMEHLGKLKYAGAVLIVSGQDKRVRNSASLVAQLSDFNFLGEIEKPINRISLKMMISKM